MNPDDAMIKRIKELEDKLRKAKVDSTERVDILHELVREALSEDSEKAKQFANEADELTQKLQYQKGLVYARLNKGIFYFFQSEIDKARPCLLEGLDWYWSE